MQVKRIDIDAGLAQVKVLTLTDGVLRSCKTHDPAVGSRVHQKLAYIAAVDRSLLPEQKP